MNAIFTAKILVPNSAVGAIIGKGGSTINEMSAQCGAQMKVSSKDEQAMLGLTERVVRALSPNCNLTTFLLCRAELLISSSIHGAPLR